MSEWQPAYIIRHGPRERVGRIVWLKPPPKHGFYARVQPTVLKIKMNCGCEKAYQLHPEDVEQITGCKNPEGVEIIVCDRQVLTD